MQSLTLILLLGLDAVAPRPFCQAVARIYAYEKVASSSIYMNYISTRPNVDLRGEHGLFSSANSVNLKNAIAEIETHKGRVWTMILSLRREDAASLGYDTSESWRQLIIKHSNILATSFKIKREHFRWYAAFHNEGHHPHIHMMVWSQEPSEGFLTPEGIYKIRSSLTNDIFEEEMKNLYHSKDLAYKEMTSSTQATLKDVLEQISRNAFVNPVIEMNMRKLANELANVKGKKQYGYLHPQVKQLVNTIADELAKEPIVASCYEKWYRQKAAVIGYYTSDVPPCPPLSQQNDLKKIKNMIIAEAEHLRHGYFSFNDDALCDTDTDAPKSSSDPLIQEYFKTKETIFATGLTSDTHAKAIQNLSLLWEKGCTEAAVLLGNLYLKGEQIPYDSSIGQEWLRKAADLGNANAQYYLGKLLLDSSPTDSQKFLMASAAQNHSYAQYLLAKEFLSGNHFKKDISAAVGNLKASATLGNQYAQYALGKIYLQGKMLPKDVPTAMMYFKQAAEQGNTYAQQFIDHANFIENPELFNSTTLLMHHMGTIFQENSIPPSNPKGIRVDSKRRKYLLKKRLAAGHKIDDHEDIVDYRHTLG